ncbi:AAA family ATPase [Kitasatospora sp. NPDC088783]|uniref:AAA family ATPase n=1 Tax=Kitasatospora sp. NPDC088783 TaxID=3364077 RepID=UPI0037FD199D
MRLHRLTVTAFGPFAGTERIDFDLLSAAGLFLLRGATGAGKSSVLDAVCYALYGELPGTRRSNGVRSDHAAPGVRTEVVLEATLGGRRLEITRSPEQWRPKKRGTGLTPEKAQTLLREWAADAGAGEPGWVAVSRSHQEAGEELTRLLGMSREQFCQVVLLPQGDFARFLRADSKQRADLLGRLFDTGRFEQLERWTAELRLRHEREVQGGRQRLHALAARAEEAAGPLAGPGWDTAAHRPGEDAPVGEVLAWAAMLRVTAAERAESAALRLAAAEAGRAAARTRLERQNALAERQSRHRLAQRERLRLTDLAARSAPERARLEAALAAEAPAPLRAPHRAALAALERAEAEEAARRAELAARASAAGWSGPLGTVDELRAAEGVLRAEVGRLEAAGADETRYRALLAERAELTRRRDGADDLAADSRRWLDDFENRHERLQQDREAAREARAGLDQLDARHQELTEQRKSADRHLRLLADRTGAEDRVRALTDAAQAARQRTLDLQERRLTGMAAELAAALAPGAPCRVCGSPAHPAPAEPSADQVTAGDERRARAAQHAAEDELAAAARHLSALTAAAAAAEAAAGGHTVDELTSGIHALTSRRNALLHAAERWLPLGQQLERLERDGAAHREQLRQAGEQSARLTGQLGALAAELATLEERLATVRGDAPSVAARTAAVTALSTATTALLDATRATAAARAHRDESTEALRRAARAAGFADLAALDAAVLPPYELDVLRRKFKQLDADLELAAAQLADPALRAAAELPPADAEPARAAAARADELLARAHSAHDQARRRVADLARIGRELAALATELAPVLDAHARISRLSALLAGAPAENALRMRLESYVLAARLEQVAAAASRRLLRMSGGRYTLVHSDGLVSGNRRSGLSLHVVDAWTGRERDTATLSGGESFFASLALALGLADVVTDEAGGMPLDTLFIDEGFGTLDENALEEVMDVLDSLRERDRAVGIVSHVADLRTRIPAQLLVRKHRTGSTVHHTTRENA